MPRITRTRTLDPAGLANLRRPRDDIVGERIESSEGPAETVFVQDSGPFEEYRRVVAVDASESATAQETIEFRLPLGTWRFLTHWAYGRALKRNPQPGRMPWWAPPQRCDARAATVLGLLATLSLVLGYLGTLLGRTMTFAADEFDAGKTAQGVVLSTARIGAVLALIFTMVADRKGRRVMLSVSLLTGIAATALGAITPNLVGLATTQAVTRGAWSAGTVLLGIIVAEEMPAGARAYAVSLLTMTGALGAGLELAIQAMVADIGGVGSPAWRIMYAFPLLLIPVVIHYGRLLPETRRYERPHREISLAGHTQRLWMLAAAMFLLNIFLGPVPQFQNDFLRDERGFSAADVSLFVMLTSTPGALGIIVGGRLAESIGRRRVAAFSAVVGTCLVATSFAFSGVSMWLAALVGTIVAAAVVPSITVYWPELFPTSLRGQANGMVSMAAMGGSVVGLLTLGPLADKFGSFASAVPFVAIGPVLMAILVLKRFPETARRELEDLNPEDRLVIGNRATLGLPPQSDRPPP